MMQTKHQEQRPLRAKACKVKKKTYKIFFPLNIKRVAVDALAHSPCSQHRVSFESLKLPGVKVLLKYQRDTYTSKCFLKLPVVKVLLKYQRDTYTSKYFLEVASCQSAFEISKGYIYIKVLLKLPVVKVLFKSQSDYINQSAFKVATCQSDF